MQVMRFADAIRSCREKTAVQVPQEKSTHTIGGEYGETNKGDDSNDEEKGCIPVGNEAGSQAHE